MTVTQMRGSVFMVLITGSPFTENMTVTKMWHFVEGLSQPPAKKKKLKLKHVGETVPVAIQAAAEFVGRDDGGETEAVDSVVSEVEPKLEDINRALDDEEAVGVTGRAEENVDMHVVDTAYDSHSDDSDSGIEDTNIDSDSDERQVDSLIKKYL